MSKKQKIDFNNPGDFGSIVNEIASSKTGKKVKIPFKGLLVLVIYLAISGLFINCYWLYLLILKLV